MMAQFRFLKRRVPEKVEEYGAVERKVGPLIPRNDGKPPGIRPGQSVRVKGKNVAR